LDSLISLASQGLQHRQPGRTRTRSEGIVDAGNVCRRELEISCTCVLRGVLLQFGYFVQTRSPGECGAGNAL
jgi:hypothetical protein